MTNTEKKINKRLVGLIIGSAIIGASSLSMTPKGKSFWRRLLDRAQSRGEFLGGGAAEMKKNLTKNSSSAEKTHEADEEDIVKE